MKQINTHTNKILPIIVSAVTGIGQGQNRARAVEPSTMGLRHLLRQLIQSPFERVQVVRVLITAEAKRSFREELDEGELFF